MELILFHFRRTKNVFKLNIDSGNLLKKNGNTSYTKWYSYHLYRIVLHAWGPNFFVLDKKYV